MLFPPVNNHRVFARGYFVVVLIVCTVGFMYAILPTRVSYEYNQLYQEFQNNFTQLTEDSALANAELTKDIEVISHPQPNIKYILQWNTRYSPFDVMGEGHSAFNKLDCEYKNCFVTDNKDYLGDITKFDAIAFSGKHIPSREDLPKQRSQTQKYIFGATESAHNYRICDPVYDGFFNWTWTYRLDSDIRWGYITIYDLEGRQVGPKEDMTWPKLAPVSDDFKQKLDRKTKVVSWFVSHCKTLSGRERFVADLSREAQARFGWMVDVYGSCGKLQCPREQSSHCFDIIEKDYYFYLAFENSFAQDYVTEKLLNALNNDAVPVVFGSANYSRFLPPGSYIDARELGAVQLAETMDAIYKNKTLYYEFFRWKNHFNYKETFEQDVCNLCTAMNDVKVNERSEYKDFRRWWNDEQWDGRDSTC